MSEFKTMLRKGDDPRLGQYPGFSPNTSIQDGMLVQRDVTVQLRDGTHIFVDVFRPPAAGTYPALVAWSPYGKHTRNPPFIEIFPERGGVRPEWVSRHAKFEAPDPAYWVPHGYAIVNPDIRGSWHSEGESNYYSHAEGEDFYDLIEWVAEQPWSDGKVGSSGVSYLAIAQWHVAAAKPPHLVAINPWEGFYDLYREWCFHGGIPDTGFPPTWYTGNRVNAEGHIEDIVAMMKAHPLWDAYWDTKIAALSEITVPAYIVASWSDHGLHSRGTLEGFRQISSEQKWLEVHGRRKWEYYYEPSSVVKQRLFFDHFLKGTDDSVLSWPRVVLEVREKSYVGTVRPEAEWPLARTIYERLYLDGESRSLGSSPPAETTTTRYDAGEPGARVTFDYTFADRTELTGYMKLRLWVESEGAPDMDLFVALDKLDPDGERVAFPFASAWLDGPVALGWLRVSHRELDPDRSTDYQPWHTHDRELMLSDGEIVPVEIEIWPSSTVFEPGSKLHLTISNSDIYRHLSAHTDTRNGGMHVIHTGREYDSYLLVPVVPPRANKHEDAR